MTVLFLYLLLWNVATKNGNLNYFTKLSEKLSSRKSSISISQLQNFYNIGLYLDSSGAKGYTQWSRHVTSQKKPSCLSKEDVEYLLARSS